jgi:hypothetical protein
VGLENTIQVADPAGLAAQDSVLVPQHQELGVLRCLVPITSACQSVQPTGAADGPGAAFGL